MNVNDIFSYMEKSDQCNYADDSNLYTADKSLSLLIASLKKDSLTVSNWFYHN